MTEDHARELTALITKVLPENSCFTLMLKLENDKAVGICGNIRPEHVLNHFKQIVEVMEKRVESGNSAMDIHDK